MPASTQPASIVRVTPASPLVTKPITPVTEPTERRSCHGTRGTSTGPAPGLRERPASCSGGSEMQAHLLRKRQHVDRFLEIRDEAGVTKPGRSLVGRQGAQR